jgi:hemoglobin
VSRRSTGRRCSTTSSRPAYAEFGLPEREAKEIDEFLRSFKDVVVGSPSYKDVLLAHPDMDVLAGMESVVVHWPAPRDADAR